MLFFTPKKESYYEYNGRKHDKKKDGEIVLHKAMFISLLSAPKIAMINIFFMHFYVLLGDGWMVHGGG